MMADLTGMSKPYQNTNSTRNIKSVSKRQNKTFCSRTFFRFFSSLLSIFERRIILTNRAVKQMTSLPPPPMNSYLPLPRAAPPVEVPGTYQPTGRPAPMRPPVSGMFQPIGPPAAAAPPLLSVADGQLSMVYLAKTVPFSSVAPGTRFVTEPDHPELHKTCMTSFEKDVLQLEIAKLTRQIKDSTTAYDRLNGWYSTMKGEFRTLDSDYQRLNTHHVNLK